MVVQKKGVNTSVLTKCRAHSIPSSHMIERQLLLVLKSATVQHLKAKEIYITQYWVAES